MEILHTIATYLYAALIIIVFLGGSIFVHELGHFLAARKRGLRVERFSIGFGPKIISWHGADGTEYRISWLPLGGYVALPDLAPMPEIEGETTLPKTDKPPPTYTTKLIVFVAGAAFNILFALILATILWIAGTPQPIPTQVGYVSQTIENSDGKQIPGPARNAIRPGDIITRIDNQTVTSFEDIDTLVALGSGRNPDGTPQTRVTLIRDNTEHTLSLTPAYISPERIRTLALFPDIQISIAAFAPDSPAREAGFQINDILTHVDGHPINSATTLPNYLRQHGANPVRIDALRDGNPISITLTPKLISPGDKLPPVPLIGIQMTFLLPDAPIVHIPPHTQVWQVLRTTWFSLKSLVSPRSDIGVSKLSGPVGIANIFVRLANTHLRAILAFTVLININLAILNLLPIPVLDGGHILFATIEKLRRRPLPQRFVASLQATFICLLLTLFLYITVFDIRRLFH